jgi:hypothetical protein
MPRLSVYVPDDLWGRALDAGSTDSPSQVVQEALTEMVARRASRELPFARTEIDQERLAKIEAEKRAELEELFQAGLKAGLDIADSNSFEALDWLHRFDFDLDRPSEADWEAVQAWPWAGDLQDPEPDYVGTVFALGRQHALRSVWEAVMSQKDSARSEPGSPQGEEGH